MCLSAGAVLPLSFAPFGWFWLAPVCYAVLFHAWRGVRPARGFCLGWLFGFASFLGGVYWIYISVHEFSGAPASLALLLIFGLVTIMAAYNGSVGWLAARWFGTEGAGAWLVALPALWVLAEWVRGWFLSGFGWLAAGYSQTDSWLMGYAPIAGVYGMSWAVLVSSGALVCLQLGGSKVRARGAAALVAVVGVGFGFNGHRWTEPKGDSLTVALVQGAVPQDRKWLPEQRSLTLDLYRELTERVHGTRLVIWPEAAIPDYYRYVQAYLEGIERDAAAAGSSVMLGILRIDDATDAAQNALYLLGEPDSIYVKRHLVPYGEYFPVPDVVRGWLNLPADTAPGIPNPAPLEFGSERIGVTICYEDVFGAEQLHYLPEATLLVNVSNDAWFGDSIAPHQHLQIARVRAAEAGRYLLRSTNTGVTAIIDPSGRLVASLPQFEPDVLRGSIQGWTGSTPYARWGNYFVVLAALVVLIVQRAVTKFTIRPGT